jgi:predicted amidohydrolase YtcJ
VTHEYRILLGGTVLPALGAAPCDAIAWAGDTVIAIGRAAEVRAISRGDSRLLRADGGFVTPLGDRLEIGSPADFAVFEHDPRLADPGAPRAVIRGGRLVAGSLPSAAWDAPGPP